MTRVGELMPGFGHKGSTSWIDGTLVDFRDDLADLRRMIGSLNGHVADLNSQMLIVKGELKRSGIIVRRSTSGNRAGKRL